MSEMVGVCDDEYHEEDIDHDRVRKYRGKDIDWVLIDQWPNKSEFSLSSYNTELKTEMNMKKRYKTENSWAEHWVCKFNNKRGFHPCLRQFKINYPHTCHEIVLWTNQKEHSHIEDINYKTDKKYHWTVSQENLIRECIHNGHNNARILNCLKEKGASSAGIWPSLAQVGVKKRNMKKSQRKYVINDYNKMKEICERNSSVPDNEHEPYVPFFYIDTTDPMDPTFTVIWSTKYLESKMSKLMIQDDATYKLNYFDFPVFVSGRSSMTGRFFMTHMALSSHENTAAWVRIFAYQLSCIGCSPRYFTIL